MINEMVKEAQTIAIGGHIRPDGDCIGSCMGMYLYLKENYPEKKTDVFLEDIADRFAFIEETVDLKHEALDMQYDLFIALDCSDKERLGFSIPMFDGAKKRYCIDHHISNKGFADENYIVPDASSASELVFHVLETEKISQSVAECLYLGIAHDTGVFQYSCAGPETFRVTASLLEKKINATKIVEDTFFEKTFGQQQVLGYSLLKSKLYLDGKCMASYLRMEDMEKFQVTSKDLDGIVSQLRLTKGVETAIFLYELEQNKYKVSLRSGDLVDVSRIAGYHGGGGHIKAAGCSMEGDPEKAILELVEEISKQIEETA